MRPPPQAAALAIATVLATGLAACGGTEEADQGGVEPADPAAFPRPERGQSLAELRAELPPQSLIVAPAVSVLESGESNRIGFGLFDAGQKQVAEAQVALYFAQVGGGAVEGPYPATYESLAVDPQFQGEGTLADPDAATGVYTAEVPFERPGRYELLAMIANEGELIAATSAGPPMRVQKDSPVPDVGERAPKVSTPTVTSAAGDLESIDTRVPPVPELHEEDFADVLGKRPAVLLFATPALCSSRVCGPVVDVQLQVKAAHEEDDVAFIHQEIYEDNELEAGFRPQVRAFDLPTEPWLFAVDADGRIAARLEGAFSADELEQAVDAATSG